MGQGILVDHHCHLDFPQFADQLDAMIERAHNNGVAAMVTICTKIRELDKLLAIANAYPNVFCSVGTHPHYADEELDIAVEEIIDLSQHPKVVAIGEAGLDYYYQHSSKEGQAEGFRRHIEAARQTGLPLEIHARDADEDTARILEEEYARGPFKAILHCYTGGPELAKKAIDLGMIVSFTGVITFKKSQDLRDIAATVPLDQLLVETDAPYLAPMPFRGKTNEPSYVRYTAEAIADVKGVSIEELATATTQNFLHYFDKVPSSAITSTVAA